MQNGTEINIILLSVGFIGITQVVLGFILRRYPPKRINPFYGYRTRSSMRSQERWEHAQSFSARELVKQGVVLMILGPVLGLFLEAGKITSIVLFLVLLLGSFLVVISRTERSIKNTFK